MIKKKKNKAFDVLFQQIKVRYLKDEIRIEEAIREQRIARKNNKKKVSLRKEQKVENDS